jgi:hypothetical protein
MGYVMIVPVIPSIVLGHPLSKNRTRKPEDLQDLLSPAVSAPHLLSLELGLDAESRHRTAR